MSRQVFVVNAFADGPFTGNPAGVCVVEEDTTEAWMQSVATQLNVSETAFIRPLDHGEDGNHWAIRWFTPATEVDLCGHATLASACAVWSSGLAAADRPIDFHSRNRGRLHCQREWQSYFCL